MATAGTAEETGPESGEMEMECRECEDDSGENEAQISKGLKQVYMPTAEEVRDHERTHLPFRDWCEHCVRGRAQNDHHKRNKGEEGEVPKISWDYFYMFQKRDPKGKSVEKGLPCVAMRDSRSKLKLATMVPNKGECEYAIRAAQRDVTRLMGYDKMIFKSDQEEAIKVFLDRVQSGIRGQIIREESPVGESHSHGEIESAIKVIEGLFRTLWSNLETNLGTKVEEKHPICLRVWVPSPPTR